MNFKPLAKRSRVIPKRAIPNLVRVIDCGKRSRRIRLASLPFLAPRRHRCIHQARISYLHGIAVFLLLPQSISHSAVPAAALTLSCCFHFPNPLSRRLAQLYLTQARGRSAKPKLTSWKTVQSTRSIQVAIPIPNGQCRRLQ